MDGSGGGNTMGRSDSIGGTPKKGASSTESPPSSVKKVAESLREVGYGGPSKGKFAVYILIPLDFLNSDKRRQMIEAWVTFFNSEKMKIHRPKKYNCDMTDPNFVNRSHSIYKAGRTGADIDRYYDHSPTVTTNAPQVDVWLYHTYVSFSGDSIYYNDNMQKDVEKRFLKKLEPWRIPLNPGGIGMTEMTFGCSLESPSPESLQYLVHSSVLEEVIIRAENTLSKQEPGPNFTWKANGTDIGRGRASRYNSGTGFQVGQTFTFLATQDEKGERHPNDALRFIITNAVRHLKKYNYEMMYAWLEHLDIKLQHYPDYQFENEKRKVREYAISRALKGYKDERERQEELLKRSDNPAYPVALTDRDRQLLQRLELDSLPVGLSRKANREYAKLMSVAAKELKEKDDYIDKLEAENMYLRERVADLEGERRARDRKSPKPQQELHKQIDKIKF